VIKENSQNVCKKTQHRAQRPFPAGGIDSGSRKSINEMFSDMEYHRRSQGGFKGAKSAPRFVAYLVVLCFEKRCPQSNAVARFQSKH